MNFYKMVLSYDGTDYQGWQEQKSAPTLVGTLKKTFKNVFHKQVSIIGASRTDAGVHALGQIARIKTDLDIDTEILKNAWNSSLPIDISILSVERCDEKFHPMYNVLQKTYFYHFFLERPLPFNARYGNYYKQNVDLSKLQESLKLFIGTHDFRSFATGNEMKSTIRTIDNIQLIWLEELNVYRIVFEGKSFLHHMIRRIVGACFDVSIKPSLHIDILQFVLDQKNPNQALPNAEAKGLMLYKIIYRN